MIRLIKTEKARVHFLGLSLERDDPLPVLFFSLAELRAMIFIRTLGLGALETRFSNWHQLQPGAFLCELWLWALEWWDLCSTVRGGTPLLAQVRQASGQRTPWLEAAVLDWMESMHGSEN